MYTKVINFSIIWRMCKLPTNIWFYVSSKSDFNSLFFLHSHNCRSSAPPRLPSHNNFTVIIFIFFFCWRLFFFALAMSEWTKWDKRKWRFFLLFLYCKYLSSSMYCAPDCCCQWTYVHLFLIAPMLYGYIKTLMWRKVSRLWRQTSKTVVPCASYSN